MAEIRQRSEVLAPHYSKVLKYSGERPSRVLKFIPGMIRTVFKVTSTNFFEDIFKWDNLTENNLFYAAWRGKDTKDNRTALWVDVKVQGEQNEKSKDGNVTIWLRSYLITKFPYNNDFQKGIIRIYSRFFYSDQRRRYSEEARVLLNTLEREIRLQLGLVGA